MCIKIYRIILVVCLSFFINKNASAQFVLDSTFSNDGMRIDTNTFTATYPVSYQKIIELPDGSYIGGAKSGIHKILQNGNKDLSFGINGSANFPTSSGFSYDGMPCVKSIARQRDGKIVVLVQVKYANLVNPFMCLMRFTSNGVLDNTFHTNGYFIDSLTGHSTEPWGMTIDTVTNENKDVIYVCGTYGHCTNTGNGGTYCSDGFYVMAVGPSGNYETNFKQAGTWTGYEIPYHTGGQDYFTSMHVISPDNIILTGIRLSTTYAFYALKINSSGAIDSSFGINGLWEITDTLNSFSRYAFSKRLGADKILLYHSSQYYSDSTYITYRCFDTSGQTVMSFGQNGKIVHSLKLKKDIGSFFTWFPMAIDANQNIYTATYSRPSTTSYIHLLKMLPNGNRDATFGNNGLLITEPIANDNCLNGNLMYDALCTKNDKLVLAFMKDYNINAMSYGGGIYRYKQLTNFPNAINDISTDDIQITTNHHQLSIGSTESGIHYINIMNLNGQKIFSTSIYLSNKQSTSIYLPSFSSGIYITEVRIGKSIVRKKIFLGE